jgi:hypothetical protein
VLAALYRSLASAALIFASTLSSSVAASKTVPLNVVHVAPLGDHQLVVYSVCSPEHCWHTFYVRKIEWATAPQVICRKPVKELNVAADFIARTITPSQTSSGALELHMVSSHQIFEPQSVAVRAWGACEYELGKLPAAAANNSSKPTPLRGAA